MYRVTLGFEHEVISTELARTMWDEAGEDQRTGNREGAFILWRPSENGWRGTPVVFKPCEVAGESLG